MCVPASRRQVDQEDYYRSGVDMVNVCCSAECTGLIPIEYRNKIRKCFDTELSWEKEDNCAGEKAGHRDQKKE